MARAKGSGPTAGSFKPGESGNPNGRPSRRSMRWHADEHFTDEDREQAVKAVVKRARAGDDRAVNLLTSLLGEGSVTPPTNVNILALISGQPDGRELLQRLFAALPLGSGDAGGLGGLRVEAGGYDPSGVDAVAPSDADQ